MPLAAREQTFKILARIGRHDGAPNEGAVAASVICPRWLMPKIILT